MANYVKIILPIAKMEIVNWYPNYFIKFDVSTHLSKYIPIWDIFISIIPNCLYGKLRQNCLPCCKNRNCYWYPNYFIKFDVSTHISQYIPIWDNWDRHIFSVRLKAIKICCFLNFSYGTVWDLTLSMVDLISLHKSQYIPIYPKIIKNFYHIFFFE